MCFSYVGCSCQSVSVDLSGSWSCCANSVGCSPIFGNSNLFYPQKYRKSTSRFSTKKYGKGNIEHMRNLQIGLKKFPKKDASVMMQGASATRDQ